MARRFLVTYQVSEEVQALSASEAAQIIEEERDEPVTVLSSVPLADAPINGTDLDEEDDDEGDDWGV